MTRKKDNLAPFRLAVHGWSFASLDGMISRHNQGEEKLNEIRATLTKEEIKKANKTLQAIRLSIRTYARR